MNKRGNLSTFLIAVLILFIIIFIKRGAFDNITTANLNLIINPLIVIFVTVIVARLMTQILHEMVSHKRLQPIQKTRYRLFTRLINVIIYAVGIGTIISMIPQLRAASLSIFAGAGVLAVIIGFATQKTFSNLASGVFIATYQPFRIGDIIQIGDDTGMVEDINLRHTVIQTWDNRRIIIPNSTIEDDVIKNYTIGKEEMLSNLDIGISYDSDIDLARKIMIEEAMLHPDFLDLYEETAFLDAKDPVKVRTIDSGEYSITLRLYFWAPNYTAGLKMRYDLLEKIKKRFDKEGVEIPFPYRTIIQKEELPEPIKLSTRKKSIIQKELAKKRTRKKRKK